MFEHHVFGILRLKYTDFIITAQLRRTLRMVIDVDMNVSVHLCGVNRNGDLPYCFHNDMRVSISLQYTAIPEVTLP